MNRHNAFMTILVAALAVVPAARSGHELPVYPSYYPHEIELVALAPELAAERLIAGKIQAHVGRAPRFLAGPPPPSIESIPSLGSFVVIRVNPASPRAKDERAVCAVAEAIVRGLAGKSADLILHPYPVTPFHGDYLHHVDLADAAKARILGDRTDSPAVDIRSLKVKADGALARTLARPAQDSEWDVEIAEVDAAELVAAASFATNGWLGPPWARTGWFHATLLLRERAGNEALNRRIETDLRRLKTADHGDAIERINLERSLVAALAGSCHTRVAGYTVKREYFSTVFTAGIENVAHDSLAGFNSPMFIRTVKLKDFPWNGWLVLGIHAPPAAAWNPVAGFSDEFGRLMWSAVGDAAMIPSPNDSGWILNRITDVQSSAKQ